MFFLLTNEAGPNWDRTIDRREQEAWDQHGVFMDMLVEEGFIIMGGPVDELRTVLVVEAESERDVRETMARDPWTPMGILQIAKIQPWQIWLGSVKR